MFGRNKTPRPAIPSASSTVDLHVRETIAQTERNQKAFNRWLEHKLIPVINYKLRAAASGRDSWLGDWQKNTYRLVTVGVDLNGVGVRMTTFVDFIYPVVEQRYRAAGYHVTTETFTQVPDYDFRTDRDLGMRELDSPMYVTHITYAG
jgi:hypothetical protein